MSRRRKKSRRAKVRPNPSTETVEPAAPESITARTEKKLAGTKPLGSRLGAFAVLLSIHLTLLGSFYALAAAYPAETKIIAADQACLANKTVMVTARIHYGLPPLLRPKPPRMVVRIGLQGQKPVDAFTGPSSRATAALVAPGKTGNYTIEIEADPDGSAGIGPLRTSARLDVIAAAKRP